MRKGMKLITTNYPQPGLEATVLEVIEREGHKLGNLFVKAAVVIDGKEIELEELPVNGYFEEKKEESTILIDVIEKLTEGNYEINNKKTAEEVNIYKVLEVTQDKRGIYLLTDNICGSKGNTYNKYYLLQYIKTRNTYKVIAAN